MGHFFFYAGPYFRLKDLPLLPVAYMGARLLTSLLLDDDRLKGIDLIKIVGTGVVATLGGLGDLSLTMFFIDEVKLNSRDNSLIVPVFRLQSEDRDKSYDRYFISELPQWQVYYRH